MKKLLFSLLGISVALMLGSCSIEKPVNPVDGDALTLSIEVEKFSGATATRASVASENGEDTINSLYLLFFNQTSNLSGKFVECVDVFKMLRDAGETIESDNLGMNIDINIYFDQFPKLNIGTAYNILAIANVSDNFYMKQGLTDWLSEWDDKKESEVMANIRAYLPAAIDPAAMLMHGRVARAATEPQVHMVLSRDMVRFDVNNEVKNTYDLVSVSVWNSYPSTALWSQGVVDYSSSIERVRRHDDVNNENNHLDESANPILGDIRGGIYAFENQVSSPEPSDKVTTCLIVGMRSRSGGEVGYYRVNILDQDTGVQQLIRNNVYTLNITGVSGPGASTEEIAYLGQSNEIEYIIVDEWEMDDNGTIVKDDYSQLSIATKTVQIGREAKRVEVAVNTFSTLENQAPPVVRSQTYRPAGSDIVADMDGNTLVITATELRNDETQRNGVIVISYAGLEIALNVVQAGKHDNFLIIHQPDGGIKRFLAFPGVRSGLIGVEANKPWTATLYMSGFSFNPSPALAPVTEIHRDDDPLVTNETSVLSKFEVYTHSYNMTGALRKAYIIVALDDDPETLGIDESEIYNGTIILEQNEVKQITVDPLNGFATFNGAGTGLATGLTGNTDTFIIDPGRDENNLYNNWEAVIEMAGSSNDTACFEFVKNHDATTLSSNTIVVSAKGMNTSGRDYEATLKVFTDPGTFAEIPLKQLQANFDLNPGFILGNVSPYGGVTQAIAVDVGDSEGLKWRATKFEIVTIKSEYGRDLYGHGDVTLELLDEDGDPLEDNGVPVEFEPDVEYPTNVKFRIKFPQIYYPNRGITIGAQVTINVGGMKRVITASQDPLISRGIRAASRGFTGYASLFPEGSYLQWYRDNIKTVPDYVMVRQGTSSGNIQTALLPQDRINYIHTTAYEANDNNAADMSVWNTTKDGMDLMDQQGGGWTAIFFDQTASGYATNANNTVFKDKNYTVSSGSGGNGNAKLNTADSATTSTKIWKFFVTTPYYGAPYASMNNLSGDSTSKGLDSKPQSAVALLLHNDTSRPLLTIDPVNRIMFCGESQSLEYSDIDVNDSRNTFGWALRIFVAKAAQYGSSFTDMFIEDGQPGAVPAPWDEYWGPNALDLRDGDQNGRYGIRSTADDR